ncbi:Putative nucleoside transporter YegT [Poriferisphaera corsica]|uniref:Nucleoside transporter YegT n=1 Tax=Poriferisphaera corsica TaxID=2528020 RepID=A0A517YVZ9_9BACT|nr:MFS transporter [Poriferisphaera corsica]QDU34397.1 Putative nucleoside transporter YegT [Poriferisphaera corsica]
MREIDKNRTLTLSFMMFLQYAVRGVWLPFLAKYLVSPELEGGLGFSGAQVGWILGMAGAMGALIAPFAGQIADRYLNAEKTLAGLLIFSGVINFATAYTTDFWVFLVLSVLFSITYMPTLSLANSVAFANLRDTDRQYPMVRAMGTLGWIIASVMFSMIWLKTDNTFLNTHRIVDALKVSGVIAVCYGVWAWFSLPNCPPSHTKSIAVLKALRLMCRPMMVLFVFATIVISMIHNAYYFRVSPYLVDAIGFPLSWTGPVMAVGYGVEIWALWMLGKYVNRLGYRRVLLIGVASYIVRFGIFGLTSSYGWAIVGMSLHGINFACFIAVSFMFVERIAPTDIRHSAQTVYSMIGFGVGPILAGFYNGYFDRFQVDGVQSYREFWLTGMVLAAVVLVLLGLFFWPRIEAKNEKLDSDDLELADEMM